MSTLDEISNASVVITLKPKEGFFISAARDLVTFSFLGLCIYVSHGSSWWTFLTGSMFLLFGGMKLLGTLKKSTTAFTDKDAAIKYLQELEL